MDVPYYNTISTDIIQTVRGIFNQYKFVIKDIANEDEANFVGIAQRRLDVTLDDKSLVNKIFR